MSHDQNFKNLILDYPRQALEFFAADAKIDIPATARIVPIRQEQLKARLGERFRELDTPLLVEWPDGQREAIVFVLEEESDPRRFSIHRLAHYCLDLSELLTLNRIVPVVIFLRPGDYPLELTLGSDRMSYLHFRYIACDLGRIPVEQHLESRNLVARVNLPNLHYPPERRIEVFLKAQEGLVALEQNLDKQLKYIDFIEQYANLTEAEQAEYLSTYLPNSDYQEAIMGPLQRAREEGIQLGIKQGIRQQLLAGIELGLELKFGVAGLALLPEIQKLQDADVLHAIHEGLKIAQTLEELRGIYAKS